MQLKRAVITGLGALTPIGNTVPEYWSALLNGVSGSDLITRFDASKFKTRFACELKNFDPSAHLDRKEVRKLDPYAIYAMVAVEEAIKNSGLDLDKIDKERAGVIWASGIGGIETFFQEIKGYVEGDGTPRFSPFFIPKMISDIAAGHISMRYEFKGPNFSTVSACASASNAIIDAFNYIRLGKANIFIAGGSEAAISIPGVGGFGVMQALSTNNENYKSASRPFDKDRDGFVIGEGAGALIIEEYEHAIARGATIYAEIAGGGMSADAYHLTAPHPEGDGAYRAMRSALEDAQIEGSAIDYINVHGTSTPLGDVAEIKAIKKVFGDQAYKMNISSTKSMTGHLLGAAGAVEAIASILAVQNNIVPPTINHFTDDPGIDSQLNLTFGTPQKRTVNYAISNTFGFGGHNTCVVLKKFGL
jgi:3-oxoacyl-[acyl-carrier-protein] synthase II